MLRSLLVFTDSQLVVIRLKKIHHGRQSYKLHIRTYLFCSMIDFWGSLSRSFKRFADMTDIITVIQATC